VHASIIRRQHIFLACAAHESPIGTRGVKQNRDSDGCASSSRGANRDPHLLDSRNTYSGETVCPGFLDYLRSPDT